MATKKYIEPIALHSGGVKVKKILHDQGMSDDEGKRYCLALVEYDGTNRYAIRWNGSAKETWGFPSVGNTSTWFVLPSEIDIILFMRSLGFSNSQISNSLIK
ncbi:hypothetical protein G7061_07950 [Erysipelothrix sp. HDW6B]|uniref:hypothetical protein n=1 Tax=Erysipelothrix sp. HDW6B TaxID=2714929 RepID=UPI00140AB8B0|nr:hypothetical protein [Erysipelothrix sp. HDW6B]QIK86545.1 hypothetical protein G7061_07950 [Erysipelothrix sp. HDW6B]